jgi:uncharacterized protein YjbI with pentapeptide repeats
LCNSSTCQNLQFTDACEINNPTSCNYSVNYGDGTSNGTSVFKNITPIAYTKMVSNLQLSNFYILNLTGIDVSGVALQYASFGNGGILIDSGTIITRLPPSLYNALKAEY